jgi:hypothetical protein
MVSLPRGGRAAAVRWHEPLAAQEDVTAGGCVAF